MNDMQNRRVIIGIEPSAGKPKRRPPPDLEPEEIAIKPARRLEVIAQDGEMVHRSHTHRKNSLTLAVDMPDAYPQAACRVNGGVRRRRPRAAGSDLRDHGGSPNSGANRLNTH
jgi:hypothetical protein